MTKDRIVEPININDLMAYFQRLNDKELSDILIREISSDERSLQFVRFILDLGAVPDNSKNYYNHFNSPVHLAAKKGDLEVLKMLVTHGASICEDALFRGTPLHTAASCGQLEIVKYIISQEVDVNISASAGATALHFAAKAGHLNVIIYLLSVGANIESRSSYSTPIFWAVIGNHIEVVKLLIEYQADLDVVYHGFDGYGGQNQNLIQAATTASNDINMGHKVTEASQVIVKMLQAEMALRKINKVIKQ